MKYFTLAEDSNHSLFFTEISNQHIYVISGQLISAYDVATGELTRYDSN